MAFCNLFLASSRHFGLKHYEVATPFSASSKPPKWLDRVRQTIRSNRYSPRTEEAYVDWIKRFIRFHGIRHPQEMGAD